MRSKVSRVEVKIHLYIWLSFDLNLFQLWPRKPNQISFMPI
jgi:hypothetical protein